jgi:hypothetical protein
MSGSSILVMLNALRARSAGTDAGPIGTESRLATDTALREEGA